MTSFISHIPCRYYELVPNLLLLTLLLCQQSVFAQTKIDSLKKTRLHPTAYEPGNAKRIIDSLQHVIDTGSREDICYASVTLARYYTKGLDSILDNFKAISHANVATMIAYELTDSLTIVRSARVKGQIYIQMSLLHEAERMFLFALPIAEETNIGRSTKHCCTPLGSLIHILQNM